jgi:hypothetical protein
VCRAGVRPVLDRTDPTRVDSDRLTGGGPKPSAKQAGGTRWARNRLPSDPTDMTRACARASACAVARASIEPDFRACARRDLARVNGARRSGLPDLRIENCRSRASLTESSPRSVRPLLFDIVNVQNRTTLRATAPVFRDAQRERRPFVNFPHPPLKH